MGLYLQAASGFIQVQQFDAARAAFLALDGGLPPTQATQQTLHARVWAQLLLQENDAGAAEQVLASIIPARDDDPNATRQPARGGLRGAT